MGTKVKDEAALLRLDRLRRQVIETRDQVWWRRILFPTHSVWGSCWKLRFWDASLPTWNVRYSDTCPSVLGLARAGHEMKCSASLVLVFGQNTSCRGTLSCSLERYTSIQGFSPGWKTMHNFFKPRNLPLLPKKRYGRELKLSVPNFYPLLSSSLGFFFSVNLLPPN